MTKFVAISDTHGCHRELTLPDGDVLLHAGDVCDRGNRDEVEDFFDWFAGQDFEHKVLIWGNHDFDLATGKVLFPEAIPLGIHVLDGRAHQVGNHSIFGMPTPGNKRGESWDCITERPSILMTHRPPLGILDRPRVRGPEGSRSLRDQIPRIKPTVHLFGHIHHSYGTTSDNGTLFINASLYRSSRRALVNPPIVFQIEDAIARVISADGE